MREVPVPTGFAAHRCRRLIVRPVVILAAWLVVLQGFLAAVATAQPGAMLLSASAETAVICHTGDTAGSTDNGPDDVAKKANEKAKQALHLCCACCTAAAVAAPAAPSGARWEAHSSAVSGAAHGFTLVAARGLIRAGSSQGPPTLA